MNSSDSPLTPAATVVTTSKRGTLRFCRRGKRNSILLVALHRPTVRNAFNDDVYLDLLDALHWSASDDGIDAVVLTGTGSYFSSGADLKAAASAANSGVSSGAFAPEKTPGGRQTLHKPAGRFMMAVVAYPKILAAAVQGSAVGIATTMLLHCDLVHMSDGATLWAPFTRLALVPELCSSETLAATMGLSKANEMLLLGHKIDARTAEKWNLCSRVIGGLDSSGDPFHPRSLASSMCEELDDRLLSLPLGGKTARYFTSLVKGSRRRRLQDICREELLNLDERFDTGQVAEAAAEVQFGSKSGGRRQQQRPRSKL